MSENNIVFEGIGGRKLWEDAAGVEYIAIDSTEI